MWHQGFNRNFTKLHKYFLCTKKTKIMTLFNSSSPPHPVCCGVYMLPHWSESKRMRRDTLSSMAAHCRRLDKEKSCWIKSLFLFSSRTKIILVASYNDGWNLVFYLFPCYISGPENITVVLLSMQGQRALRLHQKHLNLCSEDEQRSYAFGTTWGWVIDNRNFIFGWTNPL